MELLRNKLLAASYSTHGANLGALFDRMDKGRGKEYEMSVDELGIIIRKILPKITDHHLEYLMKIVDADHNGKLNREQFITFIKNKKYSHHLDWAERTKIVRSASTEGRMMTRKTNDPLMVPIDAGGLVTNVATPNKHRSSSTERQSMMVVTCVGRWRTRATAAVVVAAIFQKQHHTNGMVAMK